MKGCFEAVSKRQLYFVWSKKTRGDVSSQDLGFNEIQQKWWDYMSDIMETNPDNSPVTVPLVEVFYLA